MAQLKKAANQKQVGNLGEQIATDFLKRKGYKILERNFRNKWGEIDIIAKKKNILVFVEVKTLIDGSNDKEASFLPEDKIDWKKKKQLLKMSEIYLSQKEKAFDLPYEIDAIAVEVDKKSKKAKIRHYKNILEDRY